MASPVGISRAGTETINLHYPKVAFLEFLDQIGR